MTLPMNRLIAAWRALQRRSGPPDRLTPGELAEVQIALRRLTSGFGGRRALAGKDYWEDAGLSGAYLLYFWPVSYAQAHAAVRLAGGLPLGASVLELGAGPAPMSRALLDLGAGPVTVAERNARALGLAREVLEGPGAPIRYLQWDAEAGAPVPEGRYDRVILGHVINELWKQAPDRLERRARLLEEAAGRLAPGGSILVIEPARHMINGEFLQLRDLMRDRLPILGPCFYKGACPALAEGAACHAETRWRPPAAVAALCDAAGIERESLPFSWLHLGGAGDPPPVHPAGALRVLSEKRLNKAGRERLLACGQEGRISLSAPRTHDPVWGAAWRRLERGEAVTVEQPERRESGWGLTAASRLIDSL